MERNEHDANKSLAESIRESIRKDNECGCLNLEIRDTTCSALPKKVESYPDADKALNSLIYLGAAIVVAGIAYIGVSYVL